MCNYVFYILLLGDCVSTTLFTARHRMIWTVCHEALHRVFLRRLWPCLATSESLLESSDETDKQIRSTRRWQQSDNLAKMQSGPFLNTSVWTLPRTKLLTYDTSSPVEVKSSRLRLIRTITWPPDADRQTDLLIPGQYSQYRQYNVLR